ncbi:methionine synthase (B12-dependent) [Isoptericola sp. CG 20/1183]|uniref:Methionine synthase n=1 Tax=Isoptericola halotolerans TaxID=300560 RepID=A0ABX5EAH2_9MICO|nr:MULTISPECIES: methionine synthase [Isoptericola]PRZ03860.1 methionine synthase (B12-dependent) [Isoptericola sp. CG 20/1183]PRZ04007.1 methionine synthase (B12-dependent) [Isoptericola halotolerans]
MTSTLDLSAADARSDALREALRTRVVVADGAMGTMIQAADPSMEDYQQHEGCNEILNVTRPDIINAVHDAYLEVGVDAIETNTFGANWSNLSDYGIDDRIRELARAGAALARERADAFATPDHPRWVLGSMGPGTKLPSLGHTTYDHLRTTFAEQAAGLLEGGADALLVETSQDLLQTKAAVTACHDAMRPVAEGGVGRSVPVIASVTVETTGTMLMGSEIGAALTALQAIGVDAIGLNCATGPEQMSEHLRHLARHADVPVTCMPNAGLPELGPDGAVYPLSPEELAAAHTQFVDEFSLGLVGGCCGTTPEHLRQVVEAVRGRALRPREVERENGVASLYSHTDLSQDASYLAIGERTNANGSKAFREAMLESRWDDVVDIARAQTRDGAHLLDVCVDYVGRDGVADVREVVSRLASASTLPLVIDSTEPEVIRAGLELVGGRAVVNSVNFEDGDGPGSRFQRVMPAVMEHGAAVIALTIDEEGQARTADKKVAIASRLIDTLVDDWGMRVDDIIVDTLTFPIATGQEETRRDAIETIEAIRELTRRYPTVHTTLGVSNVSFGLNPAARTVLNSVFLHEAVQAGLDSAIVHAAKILPRTAIPDEQWEAAENLVWDRRVYDDEGNLTHDPLSHLLETFSGVDSAALRDQRAAELEALPVGERLERRIIDGARKGLEGDLETALADGMKALDIVNTHLLGGMKVVGELFGSGQMQLPFVLQSAEVMKAAVALLEPHMEKVEGADEQTKGTIVLATVRGDVHDIGKNLVDIILTNNGFTVVNIGIKQPISAMIEAAEEHDADVIGMSGLLVKSTVVMKENLAELESRGLAQKWPILLGGAALTRTFVEDDLASQFPGVVRYARDAFEGLRLMEPLVAVARGASVDDVGLPALRKRRHNVVKVTETAPEDLPARSDVADDNPVPAPPFWGTRVVKGIQLADYAAYLDERATFMGQWGLKPGRGEDGASYEELVETEGRPRLAEWMSTIRRDQVMDPTVVYGYFPVWSEGDDIVVAHHGPGMTGPSGEIGAPDGGSGGPVGTERLRFTFPRQKRDRHLCLADFVRPKSWVEETGQFDVLPIQLATVGEPVSAYTAKLFEANKYREYMELHGLSVQLTEALAEFWHARVRSELGFADEDPENVEGMFKLEYRGARMSLGYPACPDMEDRRKVVELLRPERVGVTLSDELQLHPEQSTDAFVLHHPEAKYFSV